MLAVRRREPRPGQKPANQKDYTVRMKEFFDHYLMGKPAPGWMTEGIPYLKLKDHLKERAKDLKPAEKSRRDRREEIGTKAPGPALEKEEAGWSRRQGFKGKGSGAKEDPSPASIRVIYIET